MQVMTLKNGSLKPIFEAIENELIFATNKFPSNRHTLTALTEEVGELSKALLDQFQALLYEFQDSTPERMEDYNQEIFKEAVQVASMAIRVMTEGDADFIYHPPIQAGKLE